MIKKYVYGKPFETEALTENIETAEGKPGYGEICAEDGFSFTYIMDEEDIVYGYDLSQRFSALTWICGNLRIGRIQPRYQ